MKKFLFALLLLPLISMQAAADTGRHLVMFDDAASFNESVDALGGTIVFQHDRTGIAVVEGLDTDSAAILAADDMIKDIAPDFMIEMPNAALGEVASTEFVLPESPDDPEAAVFYARQWNMKAIEADAAWAAGRLGSSDVTVAILDTGIDYEYPDLFGLVDLDRSISLVPEDDLYVDIFFPGKHHVTDIHIHGTHVAATVASNGLVAAGVTSKTTLMGVKVCSAALGYCPGSAVIPGVLYAADMGADVANMSLGGGFLKKYAAGYHSLFNRVFNYAKSVGMTVVVSAGNEAIDLDHEFDPDPEEGGHLPSLYKTYCDTPATICVSATAPAAADGVDGPWYEVDNPTSYTNYGRSAVDVAAPGGGPGGWIWAACSQTSLVFPICQTGNYILGMSGTSMASPHVAGLAALMVEDYGRRPGKIQTAIQKSADDLGQRGTDPFYGKGRINVNNAVQ